MNINYKSTNTSIAVIVVRIRKKYSFITHKWHVILVVFVAHEPKITLETLKVVQITEY